MLKQITIAECDRWGRVEPAKATTGRYYTEYTLPDGWRKDFNNNFLICPDCATAKKLEDLHGTANKLRAFLVEIYPERK